MKRNWKEYLSEEQKHILRGFSVFLTIFTIFFLICILLGSCKSIKTDVKYEYRDSIITHVVYDTVHVTVTDTIHVEASSQSQKENETEIFFGEGGGTWNSQTGEATNVTSVKQSSKEKELQKMVFDYRHLVDSQAVQIDSLRQALTEAQGEEHTQQNTAEITPRSGWDRFCTWWTIGTWIVLLGLLVYAGWRVYRKWFLRI